MGLAARMSGAGSTTGRLIGLGLGPGDPELITLKAARLLGRLGVIAHTRAAGAGRGMALS
ncbi:MAG: precorrin-2 C(20)-methyltransferase, partial [Tistrella sp.]|nr:precorrin-2 C(20)-methyltransferase [Tistrella sp.]